MSRPFDLKNLLADAYARVFARPSLIFLNKALVYFGSRGLGIYNLTSSKLSGEDYFLRSLHRSPPSIIFDVGANEGDYVEEAHRQFPEATIYAFEPHPRTFKRLKERSKGNVHCINLGCDAVKGRIELYDLAGGDGTQLASLTRKAIEPLGQPIESFSIETISLDEFCAQHSISQIDLLKIDTEGNERRVLEGAQSLLSKGAIRCIQFEFNEMNVASRSFLKDFVELLPNHTLHRLLPNGLMPLKNYSPFFGEVFGYQNIVALPK